jgi:hypothetical protein
VHPADKSAALAPAGLLKNPDVPDQIPCHFDGVVRRAAVDQDDFITLVQIREENLRIARLVQSRKDDRDAWLCQISAIEHGYSC